MLEFELDGLYSGGFSQWVELLICSPIVLFVLFFKMVN